MTLEDPVTARFPAELAFIFAIAGESKRFAPFLFFFPMGAFLCPGSGFSFPFFFSFPNHDEDPLLSSFLKGAFSPMFSFFFFLVNLLSWHPPRRALVELIFVLSLALMDF